MEAQFLLIYQHFRSFAIFLGLLLLWVPETIQKKPSIGSLYTSLSNLSEYLGTGYLAPSAEDQAFFFPPVLTPQTMDMVLWVGQERAGS